MWPKTWSHPFSWDIELLWQPFWPLSPWPHAMSSQGQKEAPSPRNQNTKAGWQVPALCCSRWPALGGGGGDLSSGWKHNPYAMRAHGWGLGASLSHGEWWPICPHDGNKSWPVMTRGWTIPLGNLIQPALVERFLPMMHMLTNFLFFCQVLASHCLSHIYCVFGGLILCLKPHFYAKILV